MDGLGTDLPTIKRLCRDDMEAVDLVDRVTARPHGGDHSKFDNSKLARTAATGTTRDYALRRLRKDRPDLHERVIAGELTPHAAVSLPSGVRTYALHKSGRESIYVQNVDSTKRTVTRNGTTYPMPL